jgi:tetratricopeptide (TPR) repeat protein
MEGEKIRIPTWNQPTLSFWSVDMKRLLPIVSAVFFSFALFSNSAIAGSEDGQEDFNKAMDKKASVQTMNDLNEIIELTESALKKGLNDADKEFADKLLASTLTQRGTLYTAAIFSTNPPDPRWPQLRQLALADLEKGLKIDPKQPQALLMVIQLNHGLPEGDKKRAKEAANQAVEAAGDDAAMKAKMLVLRAALEEEMEKRLPDMNEAVRLAGEDASIYRARGALLADLGKMDEALTDIDKSVELDPENPGIYEVKSMLLAKMKKFDDALKANDKLQSLMSDSPLPLLQRAQIHNQAGKPDDAIADVTKAYEMDNSNIAILIMRSTLLFEKGDKDKALADAEECIRLQPSSPDAIRYHASLLADLGRMDDAVAALKKLIESEDPKEKLQGQLTLAQLYVAKKQSAKAIEVYSKYLEKEPENGEFLRGRGDAYTNIGKINEALADYEKAYKIDPKDSGLLNNLAWLLATAPEEKLRNGKRALELATQACELTGYKMPHILSTLAAAYAENGDFENARKWSAKAVEIGMKGQDEELKKELESYKQNKPWRDALKEEDSPAKDAPKTEEKK